MKRISTFLLALITIAITHAAPVISYSGDTLIIKVTQSGDLEKNKFTSQQLNVRNVKLVTQNDYHLSTADITDFFGADWATPTFKKLTDLNLALVNLANNNNIYRLHNTRRINNGGTLGTLVLPESLTSFPANVLDNNTKWTKIVFPNATKAINNEKTEIAAYAFTGILSIKSVVIGTSIKAIGNNAFDQCKNITSLNFLYGVKKIDAHAFNGCTGLTSVILPESLTEIGVEAFGACSNMKSIRLPHSLKHIRREAFANCSSLTKIVIPASVETIERLAFDNCIALTDVYVMGTNTKCENQSFTPTSMTYGYYYSGVGKGETVSITDYRSSTGKYTVLHYPQEAYNTYVNLYTRLIGTPEYDRQTTYGTWNNKWVYDAEGNKLPTIPDSYVEAHGGEYAGWWNFMLTKALKSTQTDERIVNGKWYTVCFPFDLSEEQICTTFGSSTEVCEFSGAHIKQDENGKDYLSLEFNTSVKTMKAHHPYMIHPGLYHAKYNILVDVATDADTQSDNYQLKLQAQAVTQTDERGNKYTFIGNHTGGTTVPKYSYYYYSGKETTQWGNGFYKAYRSDVTFTPHTAIIKLDKDNGISASKIAFFIDLPSSDSKTTDLRFPLGNTQPNTNTAIHSHCIYTLQGQLVSKDVERLSTLPAGIYILNGKKHIETSAKLIVQDLLISSYFCTFIV